MKNSRAAIFLFLIFQSALSAFAGEPAILKVGIYQNEPKIFIDDRGKPAGLWVDLLEHISAEEGWRLTYVAGTWQQCLDRLKNGEIDILPDVAFTEKRSRIYQFNKLAVLANWAQVYGRDSLDIESIEDLKHKRVAVMEGDISFDRFKLFNIPCTFVICNDYQEVFQTIEDEKADAGIISRLYGQLFEDRYRAKRTSIVLAPAELRFAFPFNSDGKYAAAIDRQLTELKDDPRSFYNQTLDKWFAERIKWSVPWEFKFALGASVVLAILFVGFSFLLKKKVVAKTLELKKSEALYRTHFEHASDVIYSIGADLKLLTISPSIERVLGYKPEELIGRFVTELDILAPESQQQAIDDLTRILKGERIPIATYSFISKSGEKRFGEVSGAPLLVGSKAVATVSVARDITEKLRSEASLRQAHNRFLRILDSIDAHIYVADMNNHEILFMNKLMTNNFGEDLTGRTCYRVFRNKSAPCSHCTNKQLVDENGQPREMVVWEGQNPITGKWYINHDRAIEWIDGRVVRLQVATDVTWKKKMEQKRLEADMRLAQAQKMEAIGTLAGGIAHDFNNILSSVIGYTELGLDEVEKGSDIHDHLQEVYAAGKRAKDLVRQILTFASQSKEEAQPIPVGTIVKEVLKFLRASIPATIEVRQSIGSKAFMMGNPVQIHQIVMNLCTNAVYAMESEGGVLAVDVNDMSIDKTSAIHEGGLNTGDYIEIKVSDSGAGIPEAIIGSIFDPYFTTKPPEEGTGMGLSVVHGIVEGYGGKIQVASQLGRGSVFTVYFPILRQKKAPDLNESEEVPSGSERVLLIDDEAPIANMSSQILQKLGYSVTTRTGSADALELFRLKPGDFDLVITDMTMPNITGDKLAVELLKIRPDIRVILCTGYSKKITDQTASEMGIKALVYKPIVRSVLAKTVRKVLDESGS